MLGSLLLLIFSAVCLVLLLTRNRRQRHPRHSGWTAERERAIGERVEQNQTFFLYLVLVILSLGVFVLIQRDTLTVKTTTLSNIVSGINILNVLIYKVSYWYYGRAKR